MRVATWNINGLRARFDFLSHWLRARAPDVVGLQELKLADAAFPHAAFAELGYSAITHGQKAWNGVAVLTREPAEVLARGLPGQEALGARLVSVRAGDLVYTSVYCPNGKSVDHEDYPRKLAWFDTLLEHIDVHHAPGRPAILGGDFNICPTPLDSWSEASLHDRIFHTDAERERFQRLLDWGLRDVFREQHPEERSFSWWDYRGGAFHKNHGLRIDFLLATQPAYARVASVEIDRTYRKKQEGLTASDHAPVLADLR
jgi:exodeoxyribonuclease III